MSSEFDTLKNNGNQFIAGNWLTVTDNMWELKNWKILNHDKVMPTDQD